MKKVEITDDTGKIKGAAIPNIRIAPYKIIFLFIILNILFFLKV